ncbi:hypothetical protein V8J82_01995 [Gymnodinialimonas sp. 2305UL16-5]|uniref:ATP-grasp domain-containing protein n=1 Tax=Gymnodinialimonas mytili TaxID=3126503 RepID=UPI0030A15BC1
MIDILILAGKRPRPGTILETVARILVEDGATLHTEWRDPLGAVASWPSRFLVHRGLGADVLQPLAALAPARVVNDPGACLRVGDRGLTMAALRRSGLPVPSAETFTDWYQVCQRAAAGSVFLKARSGLQGRGAGVLALETGAPEKPPFPGPWHVEEMLPGDGTDRKLYVAGPRVFGLLKAWPRDDTAPSLPFAPPSEMVDLALSVGSALGLEIYGVDLIGQDSAFRVVDVNPFPGFRGVDGAAQAVADHIAARADGG